MQVSERYLLKECKIKWTINNLYPYIWTHPFWFIWASCVMCVLGLSWLYDSWFYNYLCNQCLSPLKFWVRKVCQWFAAGRLFSLVSSTNKTDHHDITEILLKMTLNTITLSLLCTSNQQKKHKLCRGPSNEHSYQAWFQLAQWQWFQRSRLKHSSLRMTTRTTDAKWWRYLTWPFVDTIT